MQEREARLALTRLAGTKASADGAFEDAVRPRAEAMIRTAYAILGNDAEARDAVQDALADAWRGFAGLRDPARIDAWLARILLNRCRMALRARGRRPIRESGLAGEVDGPIGQRAGGRDFADTVARQDALERAFERLDPEQRIVLVLRYLHDRPVREIAETMGVPEGTVKSRLHAARRALAASLAVDDR